MRIVMADISRGGRRTMNTPLALTGERVRRVREEKIERKQDNECVREGVRERDESGAVYRSS